MSVIAALIMPPVQDSAVAIFSLRPMQLAASVASIDCSESVIGISVGRRLSCLHRSGGARLQ
jgi:hypothetical protein